MISTISKTNTSIFKIILTGILDPLLKDQFSGLNSFEKFSFHNSRLMSYYGYSENEVWNLLETVFNSD